MFTNIELEEKSELNNSDSECTQMKRVSSLEVNSNKKMKCEFVWSTDYHMLAVWQLHGQNKILNLEYHPMLRKHLVSHTRDNLKDTFAHSVSSRHKKSKNKRHIDDLLIRTVWIWNSRLFSIFTANRFYLLWMKFRCIIYSRREEEEGVECSTSHVEMKNSQ